MWSLVATSNQWHRHFRHCRFQYDAIDDAFIIRGKCWYEHIHTYRDIRFCRASAPFHGLLWPCLFYFFFVNFFVFFRNLFYFAQEPVFCVFICFFFGSSSAKFVSYFMSFCTFVVFYLNFCFLYDGYRRFFSYGLFDFFRKSPVISSSCTTKCLVCQRRMPPFYRSKHSGDFRM